MRFLILCSLLFLTTLSGVRADDAAPVKTPPATTDTSVYRVAPQDVLDVTVQGHDDLSKSAVVLPDGTMSYPYVGEFKATGLTLHEISDRITTALSKEIASPQVTVTVKSLHERQPSQVVVLGATRTNGKFVFKEGWRVLDLLIEAGGIPTDRAAAFTAKIMRNGEFIPVELGRVLNLTDPKANIALQPNDVLMVNEVQLAPRQVEILGEVGRAGPYTLPKDSSLVLLLSAAGPTPRAALTKCVITHEGKATTVDLSGFVTEGKLDDSIKLEPGDTLFIPQNKLVYQVYGEVAHQGKMTYPDGEQLSLVTALSNVGGQSPSANMKEILILRNAKGSTERTLTKVNLEDLIKKGDLSKDIPIQPGDTIVVQKRGSRGGLAKLSLGSVFSALSLAGLLGLGL